METQCDYCHVPISTSKWSGLCERCRKWRANLVPCTNHNECQAMVTKGSKSGLCQECSRALRCPLPTPDEIAAECERIKLEHFQTMGLSAQP